MHIPAYSRLNNVITTVLPLVAHRSHRCRCLLLII